MALSLRALLKQHFERLQIVIHGLCRNLANQRMSESYDILFCDFADGFIHPLSEETAQTS